MGHQELASAILQRVGGRENVAAVGHCATRLRFNLVNDDRADGVALRSTPGVIDVVNKGGQYQVVIGPAVADVYREINDLGGFSEASGKSGNGKSEASGTADEPADQPQGVVSRVLNLIAGAFFPIIPAIVGGGMLKAVAAILLATGVFSAQSSTYKVLMFMGDAAFYFLPIILGVSAAHKLKVNPYVAAALGGMLVHPAFIAMVAAGQTGPGIDIFGIPIAGVSYASSVIPIFLMVWLQSYVEPFVNRIMPAAVRMVTTPLLTTFIVGVVGFTVLAPAGNWVGLILGSGVSFLSQTVPWLVPTLMGALTPLLVMAGMHYGIIPVGINLLATTGKDPIVGPGMLVSNIAQGGAALAVAVRAKSFQTRSLAASSGFTAVLGITEPALYGINLRFKKPLIAAMIGGGVGGLIVGLKGVGRFAQVAPGLLALPSYIDPKNPGDFSVLIWAAVGAAVAFAVAFVISLALHVDEVADDAAAPAGPAGTESLAVEPARDLAEDPAEEPADGTAATRASTTTTIPRLDQLIPSPLSGAVVALSDVNDPVFARGGLGPGLAISPTDGRVFAPADATVTVMFPTGHAIGLTTDDGAQLLIHVGLDTVQLNGEHFVKHVEKGAHVSRGDLLVEFDIDAIRAAGYDVTTPIVVTNAKRYSAVRPTASGQVRQGDDLLELTA